jgi:dTDP-4-amino-4,6-dideoxygalactose transaminase
MKATEKLAIHGGKPVCARKFHGGPKHNLAEWQALKPMFERGSIPMARGPEVMALREKFTKMFGMKYAVTASSGTAALHTAAAALGVGRGDEVITSPVTDMGTLTAILMQNAVPVFADIDPKTTMITPETIEAKITRRTRAIIVVHLAGLAADMDGIMRLARRHKLAVIEDVAQSYMTEYKGRRIGTIGHAGCWSLNESKHIGAGDGGVMMTNDKAVAERADLFADKCYDRTGTGLKPFFAAMNYRLNAMVAAVSIEQLKKVAWVCRRRHALGTYLDRELARLPGLGVRPVRKGDYATYWYYIFHIDTDRLNCTVQEFAKAAQAEGAWCGALGQNVMDWPVFKGHPDDRHACSSHCPLYKGGAPDYDTRHYPGVIEANARSLRAGMNEYFTMADMKAFVKAIAKVAHHAAKGGSLKA